MNRSIKAGKINNDRFWTGLVMPVLLFLLLFLFMILGIRNISVTSDQENLRLIQDAVLHATVQCYAIEGMYPPDVQYLENNYGIIYDHDRYIVHYEVFAGNILPDITVIDLGK